MPGNRNQRAWGGPISSVQISWKIHLPNGGWATIFSMATPLRTCLQRRCRGQRAQRFSPIMSMIPNATAWSSRSEEHTSELQSLMRISYAVFCLKKKRKQSQNKIKHDTTKTDVAHQDIITNRNDHQRHTYA